jgi:DNA-binding SARP family transcriptional activator
LSNPELKSMGERIPYLFHNENSYSDLFYSKKLSRLFALTSLADTKANETQIKIFTMAYPPYPTIEEESKIQSLLKDKLWILIPLMIVVVVFLFWRYFVKATREVKFGSKPKKTLSKQKEIDLDSMSSINSKKPANSFFFFGGFQVFNHTGDDITRKFTPLLKELFLLIFLFSIKDKGISVSRLTELLWFSMSPKSAKNNRAVNIAKLKNLLNEVEGCGLTRKTEYWKILFDESKVYSDYFNYYKLTHQKETLKENDLESLLSVTNAGPLLGNASYEWLDEFKLECSNQITDVLMKYLDQDKVTSEPELLVRIADAILIFDIMHEEAISIKCRALIELGKHSLSKEIFNKFTRDFLTLYDEPYDKSFTDIIKDN